MKLVNNMNELSKPYINIKTKNKYILLYIAPDVTNGSTAEYAVYRNLTNVYVRELNEFYNKFRAC